ncbi:acylneuraminate cytidylyltransferase family protein [Sphingomonas hengshuiensis]|uniref:acylneuraminate cytidylyltransferase family protein n=1 Tax=Sphingomonas hengshuiensis TaxID=1609977 RepID=UPI0005C88999|nr:acylneuraminate cytidylyltransferase [Sphingomonas hengshuiensis]
MPDALNPYRDISVVIPVREGSSRVREKIFLPFHEQMTLLDWKIAQLLEVQSPDRIFLSSNSDRVRAAAERAGVGFLPRSDYLSTGHDASFSEVITGIVKDVPTAHFAWVTVVVPLMTPEEYREGFDLYLRDVAGAGSHDSLVSVNLVKEYFWNAAGALNYRADRGHTISQELPDWFRVTNGLYMRSVADTLREGYFLGPQPVMHRVGKASGIDIDEYEDYEHAVALKARYLEGRGGAGHGPARIAA